MKLPDDRRWRVGLCLSLIVAAPLTTATITACILEGMMRLAPGMLTQAGFLTPYLAGGLLAAVGASAAALALPVRYWLRIFLAVACLLYGF